MSDDCWFVIRAIQNQATAIVAGPVTGREAIAIWGSASTEDDESQVFVLPAGVCNDLLQRVGVLV